jgi:hypothetical protein
MLTSTSFSYPQMTARHVAMAKAAAAKPISKAAAEKAAVAADRVVDLERVIARHTNPRDEKVGPIKRVLHDRNNSIKLESIQYFASMKEMIESTKELTDIMLRLRHCTFLAWIPPTLNQGTWVLQTRICRHVERDIYSEDDETLIVLVLAEHTRMPDMREVVLYDYDVEKSNGAMTLRSAWQICRVSVVRPYSCPEQFSCSELESWILHVSAFRFFRAAMSETPKVQARLYERVVAYQSFDQASRAYPGSAMSLAVVHNKPASVRRMQIVRPGKLFGWYHPHRTMGLCDILHIVHKEKATLHDLMTAESYDHDKTAPVDVQYRSIYLRHLDTVGLPTTKGRLEQLATLICTVSVDKKNSRIVKFVSGDETREMATAILGLCLANDFEKPVNTSFREMLTNAVKYSNVQFVQFSNTKPRGWIELIIHPAVLLLCAQELKLMRTVLKIPDVIERKDDEPGVKEVYSGMFEPKQSVQKLLLDTLDGLLNKSHAAEEAKQQAKKQQQQQSPVKPAVVDRKTIENTPQPHKAVAAAITNGAVAVAVPSPLKKSPVKPSPAKRRLDTQKAAVKTESSESLKPDAATTAVASDGDGPALKKQKPETPLASTPAGPAEPPAAPTKPERPVDSKYDKPQEPEETPAPTTVPVEPTAEVSVHETIQADVKPSENVEMVTTTIDYGADG